MGWLFTETPTCYVMLGDAAALSLPAGDWTVAGWLKLTDNEGSLYQYFLSWGVVDATPDLNLYLLEASAGVAPNKLKGVCRDALGNGLMNIDEWLSETTPGASTAWQHVIIARQGNTLVMSLDGVSFAARSVANFGAVDVAGGLSLGVRSDLNADRCFGGYLAEWAKWSRALTATEKQQLAGVGGFAAVRPADIDQTGLDWYVPMYDGFACEVGGLSIVNNGNNVVADANTHPPVSSPSGPAAGGIGAGIALGIGLGVMRR